MKGNIQTILNNLKMELKIHTQSPLSPFNKKRIPSFDKLIEDKYKKVNIKIHGLSINVENPSLSLRTGQDSNGKKWESLISYHYGEIEGTIGNDGDLLDVFLGPSCYDEDVKIFVVNQVLDNKFDEHKIMFGFATQQIAKLAYLEQYEDNWKGFHSAKEMNIVEFKQWLKTDMSKMA